MSTSKKTSSKSSKSPAPATKSAAAKPVERQKTKAAASPAAKPTPSLAPAPAPVKAAAVVKPVASKPVQTTISARVDVGFGNALFVRGEGPGLSWEQGVAMDCIEADLWRIVLPESVRGYTFKFLVNDLTWSTGSDYTAANGTSSTHMPEF